MSVGGDFSFEKRQESFLPELPLGVHTQRLIIDRSTQLIAQEYHTISTWDNDRGTYIHEVVPQERWPELAAKIPVQLVLQTQVGVDHPGGIVLDDIMGEYEVPSSTRQPQN